MYALRGVSALQAGLRLATSSRVTGGGPAVRSALVGASRAQATSNHRSLGGQGSSTARGGSSSNGVPGTTTTTSAPSDGGGGKKELSMLDKVAQGIGYVTGFYGRSQTTIRAARAVYLTTSEHATRPEFYEVSELGEPCKRRLPEKSARFPAYSCMALCGSDWPDGRLLAAGSRRSRSMTRGLRVCTCPEVEHCCVSDGLHSWGLLGHGKGSVALRAWHDLHGVFQGMAKCSVALI
jgi:hypothetical protein